MDPEANEPKSSKAPWIALAIAAISALISVIAISSLGSDADEAVIPPTTSTTSTTTPRTTSTTTTAPATPRSVGTEVIVAVVNSRSVDQLIELTPDVFTAETQVEVRFVEFSEEELREEIARDSERQTSAFDVVMVSSIDAAQFGADGWLHDLERFASADPNDGYNINDLLEPIRASLSFDGQLFGSPLTGESSFIMYNQLLLENAGILFPKDPTWQEIAEIAEKVHTDGHAGICMNSAPGVADLGGSLTTVVNTFGGTWWEANDDGTPGVPQINQDDSAFRAATEFYVELLQNFGPEDPAELGFEDCLGHMQRQSAAMWFGPTSAAGLLEAEGLTGNLGIAAAPTGPTDIPGGGLSSWAFAIPVNTPVPEAAWEFVSFATSEEYVNIVSGRFGWSFVPEGTRTSIFNDPNYIAATESYGHDVNKQILLADPEDPGTTPRPGLPGVQHVGIPRFRNVADRCTQDIADAIAGELTVDQALAGCQDIAASAGDSTTATNASDPFDADRFEAQALNASSEIPLTSEGEPLWEVFDRHVGTVRGLALLPDGRVASTGTEGSIRYWDPNNPDAIPTLVLVSQPIVDLDVLSDGRVIGALQDGTVGVWDPRTPAMEPLLYTGHPDDDRITVAALPNGSVASGGNETGLHIWDPTNPAADAVIIPLPGRVRSVEPLADGRLVVGAREGLRIIDLASPNTTSPLSLAPFGVRSLTALPDGRIASGDNIGSISFWDPNNLDAPLNVIDAHDSVIRSLDVTDEGQLISASDNGNAQVWDVALRDPQPTTFVGHRMSSGPIDSAIFGVLALPDGRIASGGVGGDILLWDPADIAAFTGS